MNLSGRELQKIRDALYDAFPSPGQMRILVADADIGTSFDDVAFNAQTYEEGLHNLLQWSAAQHEVGKLLAAAADANPGNPALAEVVDFARRFSNAIPKEEQGAAERVLFANVGFQNVGQWLTQLDQLRRAVCRIEPQPRAEGIEGYGTGFLVAPDVVMTNDHVASGFADTPGFWDSPARAARVVCRFDCEYGPDGKVTEGTEHRLASDYQVLRSPLGEFDFAILRLARRAGDDPVLPGNQPRGFITPVSHRFEPTEPLVILQHPMAEPMKLALGALTAKDQWPADRVAYTVNTDAGSSGSPCLTQKLAVAALHHWGAAAKNTGVLMSAILAHLNGRPADEKARLRAAGLGHLLASPGAQPPPPPRPSVPGGGGRGAEVVRPPGPIGRQPRMIALTGPQMQALLDVVKTVFSADELVQLLRLQMDVDLHRVVGAGPLNQVAFDLVEWLGRRGRVDEFLTAMSEDRPTDQRIQQVVADIRAEK